MAPRRNNAKLPLTSLWEESAFYAILDECNSTHSHAIKLWNWLIRNPDKTIDDAPFRTWSVPKKADELIKEKLTLFTTKVVEKHISNRGDTTKLLIELQDGHRVETVIMKHPSHATVCVSSQIGCQMGCKFCATGTMGIIGDLTAGEIIEQLVHANAITRIRNVVFMGMGEPLNNYDNVKSAVQFMIDPRRFGLGLKHITVSTVGVVKNMYRLTDDLPGIGLAFSLHGPNQETRLKIVPAASAHKLDKLMAAIDYHISKNADPHKTKHNMKNTVVMIEYILIQDVNDLPEHAHELGQLLAPRKLHLYLNLIPYNPTDVTEEFHPPTQKRIDDFYNICVSYGVFSKVRQEMGQDIAGACGQLALVNPTTANNVVGDIEDIHTKNKKNAAVRQEKRDNGDDAQPVAESQVGSWLNLNSVSMLAAGVGALGLMTFVVARLYGPKSVK